MLADRSVDISERGKSLTDIKVSEDLLAYHWGLDGADLVHGDHGVDPLLHEHKGDTVKTAADDACDVEAHGVGGYETVEYVKVHTPVNCGKHVVYMSGNANLPSWVEGAVNKAMAGIALLRDATPRATGHVAWASDIVLAFHELDDPMSELVLLPPPHNAIEALVDGVPVVVNLAHKRFHIMVVLCDALARHLGYCGHGWERDTIEWLAHFHPLCVEGLYVAGLASTGSNEIPRTTECEILHDPSLLLNRGVSFERVAGYGSVAVKKASNLVHGDVLPSVGGGNLFYDNSNETKHLLTNADWHDGLPASMPKMSRAVRRGINGRVTHRQSLALLREVFPYAVQFCRAACVQSSSNEDDKIPNLLCGRVHGVFDRANVAYMAYVDPNGSDTPFIVVNLAAFVLEDGVRGFLSIALAIAHEYAHVLSSDDEGHGKAFRASWFEYVHRIMEAWPRVARWVSEVLYGEGDKGQKVLTAKRLVHLTDDGRNLVSKIDLKHPRVAGFVNGVLSRRAETKSGGTLLAASLYSQSWVGPEEQHYAAGVILQQFDTPAVSIQCAGVGVVNKVRQMATDAIKGSTPDRHSWMSVTVGSMVDRATGKVVPHINLYGTRPSTQRRRVNQGDTPPLPYGATMRDPLSHELEMLKWYVGTLSEFCPVLDVAVTFIVFVCRDKQMDGFDARTKFTPNKGDVSHGGLLRLEWHKDTKMTAEYADQGLDAADVKAGERSFFWDPNSMNTHLDGIEKPPSRPKKCSLWHSTKRKTDYRHQTFGLIKKMCKKVGVEIVKFSQRAALQPHCDASVCEVMSVVGQILRPLNASEVQSLRTCLRQHPDYVRGMPPSGCEDRSDLSLLADLSVLHLVSQFPRLVHHTWAWASAALCVYGVYWSSVCSVCGQRDRDDALEFSPGLTPGFAHAFCRPPGHRALD